jgi:branched-chain amino acid transport system ATP-binding protein
MLALEGVWTRRGRIQILRDVSFSMGDEVVAVVGLNGSGKTTMLRTISGLTPPNQGRITLRDQQITGKRVHEIARLGLGYMQQSNQLFPELTAIENLRMGAYLLDGKEAEASIEQAVELFPALKKKLTVRAGNLSGGERQMLALSKSMTQRPSFLLLDEPTAGLSPVGIGIIYGALAELRKRRLPILMVEQNVAKALEICDRVVVLYLGVVHAVLDVAQARDNVELVRRLMMGDDSARQELGLTGPAPRVGHTGE